ncbi:MULTISPECIES: acyl-CoA dehydrogenase family protein [unclassified Shinella]|uniref:acyl-CoA dehydrogenase family protein n=1 Tax=unclassified Shinella TaxID=2643062 RepID=UPI00225C7F23|nr:MULTISPECIES: acyl-CoA dehydrogenase family protein [unclassified Shinella]MCO5141239.1 acyl-CoA dehydrogenase family protein [Shinella sp.]MDC7260097.1 acyl-CoA dehydrogenase family protein [Shinella sp. YE25]CAI0341581.1 Acyl-CoA dehydrogenase [Rhizobiaceae bacterium]CAK7261209.1 Acyl-CoA dehydrogenase [Shinella sp. WSC3-e]
MIRDAEVLNALVEMVHRFVRERLLPAEARVEEDNAIPPEIIAEMRALGLFGMSIPEEHGGLGLTMEEEVRVAFELGYASPAFRSVIGTNNGIGSQGIIADGTEAQKQYWLPRMATGEIIGSFALTEPDVGSDAGAVKTTARRDGDHYILNGTKRYITNAPVADVFTVMARTGGPGPAGVTAFLVPKDSPGLSLGPIDRKMGQRGTRTSDVIFDDCCIPADSVIGGVEGVGFKTAMKVLNRGRLHISAVCVGAAERLCDEAVRFARERVQFGKPIAEHQLIQAMLADSSTEAFAGRAMVLEAARRFDAGDRVIQQAASAKLFCSEMVGRVADRAVQIHGGAGYMQDYPVEHFYRDVRLFRLYEGTSQIQQLIIAREMLNA